MHQDEKRLDTLITYAMVGVGILAVAALVVAMLAYIVPNDFTGLNQFRPRELLIIPERPVPQTVEEKRALLNELSALSGEGETITVEEKIEAMEALEATNEDAAQRPSEEERLKALEVLRMAE